MRRFALAAVAFFALALPVQAFAQAPAPAGAPKTIRGTIQTLDGRMLTVKSREGDVVTIALAPNVTVRGVVRKRLANIKKGDYVASTSVKGTDGKLHAVEVTIFPESLRGAGEGQFAYDLVPQGLMTNATVGDISRAPKGRTLQILYKGQTSDLVVDRMVPVVTFVPGSIKLLKRGAFVVVRAVQKPDGSLTSANITAERNGVKPPM